MAVVDTRVPAELYNEIVLAEARLAYAAGERDAAAVDAWLAEEFREFGQSGRVYHREQVLSAIRARHPQGTGQFEVLRMDLVAEDVVLLTYLSNGERSDASSAGRVALRSSLWCRRHGAWQLVFHQGTSCGVTPEAG